MNYCILAVESVEPVAKSVNTKNPRARARASELSILTGQSLTAVVISSLEARLDGEKRRRGTSGTSGEILAFADRFSACAPPGLSSADHAQLYAADGLPQ